MGSHLTRFFALSLIVGGISGMIAHAIHLNEPNTPEQFRNYVHHSPQAHVLLMFAVIFVLLGLPGLYQRLSQSMNIAGVISLPLLFVGLTLADQMHCPLEFGAMPAIYKVAPDKITEIYQGFNDSAYGTLGIISGPLVMFGVLLFLVGVWRSRELPSWPRWLLLSSLLAMVAMLTGIPHGGILFTELLYASFIAYGAVMTRPARALLSPQAA